MRDNGFALGLKETGDALAILASPLASRPATLQPALKALFSATRSDWERFDEIFQAYWLGRGLRRRQMLTGTASDGSRPQRRLPSPLAGSDTAGKPDHVERGEGPEGESPADGRGRRGGATRAESLGRIDVRRIADPDEVAEAHELAERLARKMRARLVRRMRARRHGRRLDLRRTIHRSVSHGGTPLDLVWRRRKPKPLRLVILLDASGSMSLYTAFFLRFIHGVVDAFREAEAFVFHTRLVHVSDSLRERDVSRAIDRLALMAEGIGGRDADRREPGDLQPLACGAGDQFPHGRDDPLRRLRHRRAGAPRHRDGAATPPLPPDHLAEPADRLGKLFPRGAGHAGGTPLYRSLRPRP